MWYQNFYLQNVQISCGAHPGTVQHIQSSFLGVKQLGYKDDHSLPSHAKVKNGRNIPPLPLYVSIVCTDTTLGFYPTGNFRRLVSLFHEQPDSTQYIYLLESIPNNLSNHKMDTQPRSRGIQKWSPNCPFKV
jgi:hypothetical protein